MKDEIKQKNSRDFLKELLRILDNLNFLDI